MSAGDSDLIRSIRGAIGERGPVTFAWFMEQALYHPEHGYYSSGRCQIGRGGDYFTSVSVGPLFGRLMAAQFAEMWDVLGRPEEFTIVEQGAHGGEFARDVLEAARSRHPGFFEALHYTIVEPFEVLQARQTSALAAFHSKLSWHHSLDQLPPFCGVHFSNELLDAMAVHLVRWTGDEWLERHVDERDDKFAFIDRPLSNPELAGRVRDLPLPLPLGYETEVNLQASEWVISVAHKLTRGFVLAVDYGFARDEFYAPKRATGTLQTYAKHRVVSSPLMQIGHADLTAHVEWTSIAEQALARGLDLAGFTDQHHFLTGLLTGDLAQELELSADGKNARALQTLLHPGFLGMKFQFLMLSRNVGREAQISGLRFAREAKNALGLRERGTPSPSGK